MQETSNSQGPLHFPHRGRQTAQVQARHPLHRRLIQRPLQGNAADQAPFGMYRQGNGADQERQAHRVFPVAFGALTKALVRLFFDIAQQPVVTQPLMGRQALHFVHRQLPRHARPIAE